MEGINEQPNLNLNLNFKMQKSIEVDVEPEVLRWLRESAGWKLEDVGSRIKASAVNVKAYEEGRKKPTLRQVAEMSRAFRRPLAAFFLPEPKKEERLPEDYRMLPGKKDVFDKKTILAIRKARDLQNISRELSKNIEYETKPRIKKVKLMDSPEKTAGEFREEFKLTEEKQIKFKDAYKLFNYLRDILEDMNIMVFQIPMPVEDARGFALADETPSVIVVNTKDSIEARLFSLVHEFAHIILGETVIDLPELSAKARNNVEKWCNKFASSFLLPEETAAKMFKDSENPTSTKTLNAVSRKYKVSKALLLFRMYKSDYITQEKYYETLDRYKPGDMPLKEKKERKQGGIPSDKKRISEVGTKFVSLVANNFDKNLITYGDALNYLSIKSKNFDRVLSKAAK